MTYGKPVRLEDLPDTPGKRVLMEILNTPPVDREALHQRSLAYQKKLLAEWAEEDRLKAEQEKAHDVVSSGE